MVRSRLPSPLCGERLGADWIDHGTSCRTRSSPPGPVGTSREVGVVSGEVSGSLWVARYPTSNLIADCESPFRESLQSFVDALKAAGALVAIAATRRPPQRAYLMHWSWKIANRMIDPASVPSRADVPIRWVHTRSGVPSTSDALAAAQRMVSAYGMDLLRVAPALQSHHIAGHAVDMSVSWKGDLLIVDAAGQTAVIATLPRDGMNPLLHTVGRTYGVIKFRGGDADRPHWSIDGR